MRRRFSSFFLFLFVFFLVFSRQASASEYFFRNYSVIYTVKEDGITNVSVTITLTNKTSDYYASSDTITVGFDHVANVKAEDPDGPIKPIVTKTDQGNAIELTFNKKVVGKGKSLVFYLTFDTKDIARRLGKIWEINIPGIANPDEFTDFTTEVRVPSSFGKPTYSKPAQPDNKLLFTKEQLGKSGISIAYGTEQVYKFSLMYHLRNKNLFPIRTEIALPPTTNYQEIAIDSINPRPKNVTIDKDGNWLAEYELAPSQRIDVQVTGKARVTNTPSPEPLSDEAFQEYIKEKPYWQVNNSQIKQLAAKLKTPKAIYEYVVNNLTYDFNRVTTEQPRLGALRALNEKNSAVCLEFTDLFITLARAAGIPAREINGYAHTENAKQRPLSLVQDILHAWPEYYDKEKRAWIMVDPTWGNTTGGTDYFDVFDFDHIVFVKKGMDSQYPIPAGGYKSRGDENKKDISVQFTTTFPTEVPKAQLLANFPRTALSGMSLQGSVTVVNAGRTLFPKQQAVVASADFLPRRQELVIDSIPPFGKKTVDITFKKTSFFTKGLFSFTISLGDTIIQKQVSVTPFLLSQFVLIGGVIVALLAVIIFIITTRARRLFIFRRE